MQKTREEQKAERSAKASRAANSRWAQHHAALAEAGAVIIYDQHHAFGDYEITIRSLRSGKANTLMLTAGGKKRGDALFLSGDWEQQRWEATDSGKKRSRVVFNARSVIWIPGVNGVALRTPHFLQRLAKPSPARSRWGTMIFHFSNKRQAVQP